MAEQFKEAVRLLVKRGFGTEINIAIGQGFPAVKTDTVERLQSITVDPNGFNIRTGEGTSLTPESAPDIAVFGEVGDVSSFLMAAANLAAAGFRAEVVIPQGEGSPEVEEKSVTEEIQSINLDANGIFIRTMSGRALTVDNAPNIAHYSA